MSLSNMVFIFKGLTLQWNKEGLNNLSQFITTFHVASAMKENISCFDKHYMKA
jgi:hypothetical protein